MTPSTSVPVSLNEYVLILDESVVWMANERDPAVSVNVNTDESMAAPDDVVKEYVIAAHSPEPELVKSVIVFD